MRWLDFCSKLRFWRNPKSSDANAALRRVSPCVRRGARDNSIFMRYLTSDSDAWRPRAGEGKPATKSEVYCTVSVMRFLPATAELYKIELLGALRN